MPVFSKNEQKPFSQNLKAKDKITLSGSFCIYNGTAPNIRFVTKDNKIIGIGTEELSDNEEVNKIVKFQLENNVIYETEVEFEYKEKINLDYYSEPLMCFSIKKIKILNCKLYLEDIVITIKNPKFNKQTKKLQLEMECLNTTNLPIKYSNKNLRLKYKSTESRAYLDSIASNQIDFDFIEIPANFSIKNKIYFVIEESKSFDDVWYNMRISYLYN